MTYYYIYKITCTAGSFKDHYYIGQHKTDNLDDGYKGSGVKIQKYYQKYPNNYKKEILCWCKDEEDMNLKEDFYVGDLYKTDPLCLNLRAGGNQPGITLEYRKKLSDAAKGKTFSEETRKKLSEANKRENNHMYGKHHSEEARKKLSKSVKKFHKDNPELKSGENNPAYGRKWMNNGLQQKYVKPDKVNLYLQKGYSFGRLKNTKISANGVNPLQ